MTDDGRFFCKALAFIVKKRYAVHQKGVAPMKIKKRNITVSNDGTQTLIINDKSGMTKEAELYLRVLAFKSLEDLDQIEEDAVDAKADSVVKMIQKLRDSLDDEEFMAKVAEESEKSPDTGTGWGLNIKVRKDEKFNQDLSIRIE